ncbi:MAG: hypothetical protein R2863_05500 [Candidatus Kapaibacterium sp.]
MDSEDWKRFDSKLDKLVTSDIILGDGTSSNPLRVNKSTSTTDGYLSFTDWNIFNSKLSTVSSNAPINGTVLHESIRQSSKASSTTDGYLSASVGLDSTHLA